VLLSCPGVCDIWKYLFSVNTHTPPTMAVNSDVEFNVEVRGAFDDVEDISRDEQDAAGSRGRNVSVVAFFARKPDSQVVVTTFSSGSPRTKRSMFRATSRERRSMVPSVRGEQ
jgi:hypothetical protein